jgi:hypothetical protein
LSGADWRLVAGVTAIFKDDIAEFNKVQRLFKAQPWGSGLIGSNRYTQDSI